MESEIRGPKVFYETSQLAAQALEPNVTSELTPDIQSDVKPEDYSSLNHLPRVTAWVLRFIKNLRGRKVKENNLIARELQTAKTSGQKEAKEKSLMLSLRALRKTKETNSKNSLALNLIKRD